MTSSPNIKPPDRVQVGPVTFSVVYDPSLVDDESYGITRPSTLTIGIRPARPDLERETFNHELTHACAFVAGVKDGSKLTEEDWISRISPIYLDTLRRNPEAAEYLLG